MPPSRPSQTVIPRPAPIIPLTIHSSNEPDANTGRMGVVNALAGHFAHWNPASLPVPHMITVTPSAA
eukprot:3939963-Rhodomonas_salina.1